MAKNEQEELLKNAQFRKALPMAFLNSRNSAIELLKLNGKPKVKKGKKPVSLMTILKKNTNNLMADYMEFYARDVATVGVNFKPEESIAKLNAAKNLPDLQSTWRSLSEDERHNDDVRKVAQQLRDKYNDKK
jgi:hypothetical protein